MNEEKETILLQGEDGTGIECEFGDRFVLDDENYVILIPYRDGLRDEDGILLMQTVKDDEDPDTEYLVALSDSEEINRVFSGYIQQKARAQHADGTCFEQSLKKAVQKE